MAKREAKQYKVLYFDLHVQSLKQFYPKKNHLGAYGDIKRYLLKHGFTHEQWSGYHSEKKMTDLDIFDLVHEMAEEMIWFSQCINHFEVTNVGTNYNLVEILKPEDAELDLEPTVL